MPPPFVIDLAGIDLDNVVVSKERIQEDNPQRGDMDHLEAIIHWDKEADVMVGYKEVRTDEFWCDGHLPGNPILPGVIMLEAAAQLSSFWMKNALGLKGFLAFGGVEDAKFRLPVRPPARLYLLGKAVKFRKRRSVCYVQGVVDGKLIFETTVAGVPM
jgi:3-hydroxyacyl-[acyl-carrier-protein] dehydratase